MTPDQINQLIQQLLETGTILASEAFRIALQQVHVEIVSKWILLVFLTLILIIAWITTLLTKQDDRLGDAAYFIGIFGSFFWGVLTPQIVTDLVKMTMNPEWYAIKLLLDSVVK